MFDRPVSKNGGMLWAPNLQFAGGSIFYARLRGNWRMDLCRELLVPPAPGAQKLQNDMKKNEI
eukprot:3890673-Amphidinium_carterae.1